MGSSIWQPCRPDLLETHASSEASYRRLLDATNAGDSAILSKAIGELVAADALIHSPQPTPAPGAQAIKEVFAGLRRAFPDLHVAVEDLIAEGDTIVGRHTVTGSHKGELLGLPPTGKSATYNEIFILRFAGG